MRARLLNFLNDPVYWVRVALNDPAFWAGWVVGGIGVGLYFLDGLR